MAFSQSDYVISWLKDVIEGSESLLSDAHNYERYKSYFDRIEQLISTEQKAYEANNE